MKEYIASFIKEKDLSENSQAAYSYDLDQFVDTIHNHVSDTNLRIYKLRLRILNQLFKNGSFQPSTNFCFIFINIKLLRITIA